MDFIYTLGPNGFSRTHTSSRMFVYGGRLGHSNVLYSAQTDPDKQNLVVKACPVADVCPQPQSLSDAERIKAGWSQKHVFLSKAGH